MGNQYYLERKRRLIEEAWWVKTFRKEEFRFLLFPFFIHCPCMGGDIVSSSIVYDIINNYIPN